jgi:hypothetical protein
LYVRVEYLEVYEIVHLDEVGEVVVVEQVPRAKSQRVYTPRKQVSTRPRVRS